MLKKLWWKFKLWTSGANDFTLDDLQPPDNIHKFNSWLNKLQKIGLYLKLINADDDSNRGQITPTWKLFASLAVGILLIFGSVILTDSLMTGEGAEHELNILAAKILLVVGTIVFTGMFVYMMNYHSFIPNWWDNRRRIKRVQQQTMTEFGQTKKKGAIVRQLHEEQINRLQERYIGDTSDLRHVQITTQRRIEQAKAFQLKINRECDAELTETGQLPRDLQLMKNGTPEKIYALEEKRQQLDTQVSRVATFFDTWRKSVSTLERRINRMELSEEYAQLTAAIADTTDEVQNVIFNSSVNLHRDVSKFMIGLQSAMSVAGIREAARLADTGNLITDCDSISQTISTFVAEMKSVETALSPSDVEFAVNDDNDNPVADLAAS
ncbi:hypothetical protein COT97_05930 [Candidatus Falkowbacteria bacterium CG10_big_fil_rev_8_21_14_0_10_39_11]|uniref:Uncharacterized protein n=1 Tax=Candidatus Falkowbacteria bacterium CG10_big_fil_rev_8_21_14_0_10_39_11 TaxID=1974565 RepID=A0A2H0V3C4_9BACT|nr:MAG: hypothetical protein COT97_05930 [Candidatus Falkowbacteria bacterium CG10_big_fil_rev_8_21_14_0_10_39_11]